MALSTDYLSRLDLIHRRKRPRTYLEIGVWSGRSLSLAGPDTLAIGVDPNPEITERLPPRARIFCETSDRFFATRDVHKEFDFLPIDLVFIDGFHHFEYALRDFINAARYCAPESLIVIHDVLPHDARMAERTRETEAWTGDVWKLIPALRKYVPRLQITTLDTPPTGLSLIGNIDSADTTLLDNYERIVSEFIDLDFDYFESRGRPEMNIIPDGLAEIERLIAATP
jgi:predicted O-methyltransferase YrrM